MPRPKALLFDVGNVLVRLKQPEFVRRLEAESPGLRTRELLDELRHPGGAHAAYERGEIGGEAFHALLRADYGLGLDYPAWIARWCDYFLPNRPMEVLLSKLNGQARFFALSNTNPEHLAALRRDFRLFDAFAGVFGSFELRARKPEPGAFLAALKRMGVQAGEAFFVDDLEENVLAAKALGLGAFHYRFNDLALKESLAALGFDIPRWESRPSHLAC